MALHLHVPESDKLINNRVKVRRFYLDRISIPPPLLGSLELISHIMIGLPVGMFTFTTLHNNVLPEEVWDLLRFVNLVSSSDVKR